jgi:hypothetical protein
MLFVILLGNGGVGKDCTIYCNRNQRLWLAWFRLGIWKLRGLSGGLKGGVSIMLRTGECHSHFIKVFRDAEMVTVVIKE